MKMKELFDRGEFAVSAEVGPPKGIHVDELVEEAKTYLKMCIRDRYKVEMFYTTLITIDNKHVIIPNGKLSNSTIINVTAQNLRNLEIKVGISYDSDIKKAKKLLQHILQEDPGTKSDKDMLVFVDELADSAVVMGLRVWVPTDKFWKIKWRLNEKIKESFDANGISLSLIHI